MMYSEFAEATGCKDNAHNHEVFRNLEIMYMNSDMTKEQIYEYGRKLVDNSKSKAELKLEAELKEEIESNKHMIELYKKDIEWKQELIKADPYATEWIKDCKNSIKYYREQIRFHRNKIRELKWVLA